MTEKKANTHTTKKRKDSRAILLFGAMFVASGLIFIFYLSLYFFAFSGHGLSGKIEDFAGFGSYLGGIGSIFSVFSLLFIVWTYRKDQHERKIEAVENKLLRFAEYTMSIRNSIQVSYQNRTYNTSEIATIVSSVIFQIVNNEVQPRKGIFFVSGSPLPHMETMGLITNLSGGFLPLQNIFSLTIDLLDQNRDLVSLDEGLSLLLSLLTLDEVLIIFFLLYRVQEPSERIGEIIFQYSPPYKEIYKEAELAHNYFYGNFMPNGGRV